MRPSSLRITKSGSSAGGGRATTERLGEHLSRRPPWPSCGRSTQARTADRLSLRVTSRYLLVPAHIVRSRSAFVEEVADCSPNPVRRGIGAVEGSMPRPIARQTLGKLLEEINNRPGEQSLLSGIVTVRVGEDIPHARRRFVSKERSQPLRQRRAVM